ncbi:MAG: response regulator [Chloroflexi bacterium]|nr:response regulator [Chloroflexota bacterium]
MTDRNAMYCSKGRVLIVDDLPDVRATLSGLLSDEGYDVRSASSMVEALEMLATERFHVAVLDVRLDDADEDNKDGLLLMYEIKAKYPTIAVIILTGYADVKMVQEALQPNREGVAPAFAFLEKTDVDRLSEYVERAFRRVVLGTAPTVRELITIGENDQVEFKASLRWDFKTNSVNRDLQEVIAAAIAGMLNSRGGILLIGVADDGTVLGIEKDLQTLRRPNTDGFRLALADIVKTHLGIEYMTCIHPRFEHIDAKSICVVVIESSPRPVFIVTGGVHKFWVRMGNSTRSLDVKATMNYIQANWGKAG